MPGTQHCEGAGSRSWPRSDLRSSNPWVDLQRASGRPQTSGRWEKRALSASKSCDFREHVLCLPCAVLAHCVSHIHPGVCSPLQPAGTSWVEGLVSLAGSEVVVCLMRMQKLREVGEPS